MIRSALLPIQHACIQLPGLIANGRDMGTKVFPNSSLKLYFIADLDIRAQRRYNQLVKNGSKPNCKIRKFIKDRDEKDINRDISPLKAAKDATIIDSSQLMEAQSEFEVLFHDSIDKLDMTPVVVNAM